MEEVEQNLPYICYAMAIAKAALFLSTGNEIDIQSNFERYYNDYVNTNIFMSLMVHPLYLAVMLPLRVHYKVFDKALASIREGSEGNALSLRVLLNTLNMLTTWGVVYAVVALVLSTTSSSAKAILTSMFHGVGVAGGSALTLYLLGRVAPRGKLFPWYNLGVHIVCLICGGAAIFFKDHFSQVPPILFTTLMVIGGHALGYMFMRIATAKFSSRDDRALALIVHGIFSMGGLVLQRV